MNFDFITAREATAIFASQHAPYTEQRDAIQAVVEAAAGGLVSCRAESASKVAKTRVPLVLGEIVETFSNYIIPQELWVNATAPSRGELQSWLSGNLRINNGAFVWLLSGLGFERSSLLRLKGNVEDDLSQRSDDDILVALMRRRVGAGYYPSPTAASNDLAQVAIGANTTSDSKAKRLQRLYAKTFGRS